MTILDRTARPANIRVGDVVTPSSGGPKMTVEKVDADNEYLDVIWFADNHPSLQRAKLHRNALRLSGEHGEHGARTTAMDPAAPYGRDVNNNPNPRDPNRTAAGETQQQTDEQRRRGLDPAAPYGRDANGNPNPNPRR